MEVASPNLFNFNFSSIPEIYPVAGRACASVYVLNPLIPVALKHTALPPRITTVRQAVLNAREQDGTNKSKLVARIITDHYVPRSRKSKLRACMKELIFQKDFWLWINNDKIDGQYTSIKIPKCEPPTAPTHPNFGCRFPLTDYPASFCALFMEMRILEDALREVIGLIENMREPFADLTIPPSLLDDLQAGHQEMLDLVEGYYAREKKGSIAYSNIQVPSFTLWSLLEGIITDHRTLVNRIVDIERLCRCRDETLDTLLDQLPLRGNARLRQHYEAIANKYHDHASEWACNLLKTHVAYKQQFMKLHDYFMDNMSYVPAGGALFAEEETPIVLDPIFDGFAMSPAVELRAYSWKEESSDTD
ncbi:hypothetical protein N7451_009203 [Penicillium sp. IBT 35674x]|nr:hypothetical protein N7451_009203 [Penicillium sp. IBT 35674x]